MCGYTLASAPGQFSGENLIFIFLIDQLKIQRIYWWDDRWRRWKEDSHLIGTKAKNCIKGSKDHRQCSSALANCFELQKLCINFFEMVCLVNEISLRVLDHVCCVDVLMCLCSSPSNISALQITLCKKGFGFL